ncbi:hypothetical protein Q9R30_18445 [Arthrobacter sp. AB6]|uniref:hypothetical protein n=1 Tax=Arthrobacter sp. AB6 TaxID=2962570 RepID=UPI0028827423|nr:hypothetical protein [Arthrobacter sp. AB6]MDT0197330.1 hypothetical protein [Arthrobacter sp. AB6]
MSVTNTTPQRQNPKYYLTKIEGLYDMDSPVCEIGPQTQFIKAAAGSNITYCAATLAVFSTNQDGKIAPDQSLEVKPFPGGAVIPSLDEALAPEVIAALENPKIVVASIRVPDLAGVADKIKVAGVPHCEYSSQNSASGGWDSGGSIWVVQEDQKAICNL